MTIETSSANNLFAGFNDDEKKMIAVAVRRVEELEETRRITAGMAGQAQAIQADLKARGVDDAHVLREAAEAVDATLKAQGTLASEVQDYRKLFGPDGKAASAVGQYTQLLRNAHTGDVDSLNQVQAARRELYEARDASAQERGGDSRNVGPELDAGGPWSVNKYDATNRTWTPVITTGSAIEANKVFQSAIDQDVRNAKDKQVAHIDWLNDGSTPHWKLSAEFARALELETAQVRTSQAPMGPAEIPEREAQASQDLPRYEVRAIDSKTLEPKTVLATSNALEAHDAFNGKQDREVFDRQEAKLVGYMSVDQDGTTPTWKMRAGFAAAVAALQPQVDQQANAIEQDGPLREKRVSPALVHADPAAVSTRDDKRLQADLQHALPESFAGRYVKSGDKWVEAGNAAHVIVVDKGSKLQIPREFDGESVKAAVDLAETRGWSSMKVSGDERFRKALYVEAASRGIEVKGYNPTEAEKQFTADKAAKHMRVNSVMENDVAKAFHEARTPAERKDAAQKHPELKKAFAVEAAYAQLAKQIQGKSGQDAFMARMRDNIATDLAQGRELVDVRLRKPMFKQAEYTRTQDRDQGQSR